MPNSTMAETGLVDWLREQARDRNGAGADERAWCRRMNEAANALAAKEAALKNARTCLDHFEQSDVSIREFTIDLRRALDGKDISSGRSRSDD